MSETHHQMTKTDVTITLGRGTTTHRANVLTDEAGRVYAPTMANCGQGSNGRSYASVVAEGTEGVTCRKCLDRMAYDIEHPEQKGYLR